MNQYFSRFWFDLKNVRRRGAWVLNALYQDADLVKRGDVWYQSTVLHTSAETFSIDLAAGKWRRVQSGITGEIITPQDFRIAGAADDTSALQAFINSSTGTAAIYIVPAGTYRVGKLTVPSF